MAGLIGSHATVVSSGAERKKHYNITTTTTSLTGLQYTPTKVHVYHNGVRLVDGTDYTATDGTSITLTNAAENGDDVVVISYATFQASDTVSKTTGGTFEDDITVNGDLTVNAGSATGTHLEITTTGAGHNFDMVDSSGTSRIRNVNGILRLGADHRNEVADSNIRLEVDGSERMRIDNDGLKFNGDTAAANALDDYEEGTWTPSYRNGATEMTYTMGNERAEYRKIGDTVWIHLGFRFTALSGTGTGSFRIYGLPFTAKNNGAYQEYRFSCAAGNNVNTGNSDRVFGFSSNGNSYLEFRIMDGGDTVFRSNEMDSNSFMSVWGFYIVA